MASIGYNANESSTQPDQSGVMGKAAFVFGKAAEMGSSAVTSIKTYTGKGGEAAGGGQTLAD